MADIAGVGTFGFQPVRSNPDLFRTQNEDPSARENDTLRNAGVDEVESTGVLARTPVESPEESQEGGAGSSQQQGTQDNVTLSARAQELSGLNTQGQSQTTENVNSAGPVEAAQLPSQVSGVDNNTNQQVSEESTSATLNGNQDGRQTEQNRTLGQLVDQFA